jgi:drug/metabolite transporter (DMT)-like permease
MTGNDEQGNGEPGTANPDTSTGNGAPAMLSRRPVLAAGLGAACISCSAILVTLAGVGPATTAFYRCALALPGLGALALLERRRRGPRQPRVRLGAVVAGMLLAVDLVLWNHAIAEVGAGIATVLGNLQVIFVTAAAWLLLRERPTRAFLLALPVVMTGVVLVSGLADGGRSGGHALAGIAYGLGTSIAYSGFLLILRQTSSGTDHVAGPLADATLGAALGSLILGGLFGGFQFGLPWASFGWLLLLAVGSQTIGWLLITSSLPRLPAAGSSLLLLLQPAAALLVADLVLGQRPTLLQVGGAVLVCTGVLAASGALQLGWAARRRRAERPPVDVISADPAAAEAAP